jgi:LuxR family transcriptional regulator, maltose regulon positive regulatory protein
MAAGDVDEAARLVAELAPPAEREDRLTALPRWYRWLDDRDGIAGHPMVAVWAAFFALETGQPADAERWAAMADRGPDGAWAAMLRATLCHHGAGQMRADADEAARKLAGAGIAVPAAPLVQAIARIADGDPGQAGSYLDQAASAAEDAGAQSVLALALCERSLLALARDDWGAGQSLAERAGLVLREAGLEDSNAAPLVFAVQARMVLHRRDVDGARRALVSAQRRRHLLSYAMPGLAVQLRIELIGTYLELADLAGARTLMREIDGLLAHQSDLGALTGEAHALRDRLAAERGTGAAGPSALTAAELRLLPLLSTHLSSAGIGADLSWPASTVRSRAASIYRKLGAAGRSAAVARSRELGLLDR